MTSKNLKALRASYRNVAEKELQHARHLLKAESEQQIDINELLKDVKQCLNNLKEVNNRLENICTSLYLELEETSINEELIESLMDEDLMLMEILSDIKFELQEIETEIQSKFDREIKEREASQMYQDLVKMQRVLQTQIQFFQHQQEHAQQDAKRKEICATNEENIQHSISDLSVEQEQIESDSNKSIDLCARSQNMKMSEIDTNEQKMKDVNLKSKEKKQRRKENKKISKVDINVHNKDNGQQVSIKTSLTLKSKDKNKRRKGDKKMTKNKGGNKKSKKSNKVKDQQKLRSPLEGARKRTKMKMSNIGIKYVVSNSKSKKQKHSPMSSIIDRWKREYLLSLRERYQTKLGARRVQSFYSPSIVDIVLIHDDLPRGTWRMGKINELNTSFHGQIRSAKVLVSNGKIMGRPLNMLYPIECPVSEKTNINDDNNCDVVNKTDTRMEVEQTNESEQSARPMRKAVQVQRNKLQQWIANDRV